MRYFSVFNIITVIAIAFCKMFVLRCLVTVGQCYIVVHPINIIIFVNMYMSLQQFASTPGRLIWNRTFFYITSSDPLI